MSDLDNTIKKELEEYAVIHGFGNVMHLAQQQWSQMLREKYGESGGELAIGPAVAMTVLCGCAELYRCPWCCGSGWLTAHVKKVKQSLNELKNDSDKAEK